MDKTTTTQAQEQAQATLTAVTVTSTSTNEREPRASYATLSTANGKTLTVIYVPRMRKGVIEIDGTQYAISKADGDKLRMWYRNNLSAKQAQAERVASIAQHSSEELNYFKILDTKQRYLNALSKVIEAYERISKKIDICDAVLDNPNRDAMIDKANARRKAQAEQRQRAINAKLDEYRKVFNILVKLNKFSSVDEAKKCYIDKGVDGIGKDVFNTAMALVELSK